MELLSAAFYILVCFLYYKKLERETKEREDNLKLELKRAKEVERKAREAERKAREAEKRARESEEKAREAEKRAREAEIKAREDKINTIKHMILSFLLVFSICIISLYAYYLWSLESDIRSLKQVVWSQQLDFRQLSEEVWVLSQKSERIRGEIESKHRNGPSIGILNILETVWSFCFG